MYEPFFGLSRRPFAAAADADCYFPANAIESARQTLFQAVDRGEGPGLLIGPAGSGKSLLLMVLAEQFAGRFEVALSRHGGLGTRRELLQAILYELGLPCRDLDEGEMRLSLVDFLMETRRLETTATCEQEGMLLLIDKAHTLSFKLLEEIRLITNLIRAGQPKVRLVLAGSALLEERFASPKLDTFNQRIAARCYLQTIDRNETFEYIKAQIAWAGGQPDRTFTQEAYSAVYQATQGIPRLINQVCDHALVLACAAGNASIGKAQIEEAWADLQQLPTPWNRQAGAATTVAPSGGVIEFGVLADDDGAQNWISGPSARNTAADSESDGYFDSVEIEVNEDVSNDDDYSQDSNQGLVFEGRPAPATFAAEHRCNSDDSFRENPLGQLAHVEEQLAAIDIDLGGPSYGEPYGAMPMTFDSAVNPFAEQFAEEEVIIDPFAMTAGDALANRQLVQSEEGRRLGGAVEAAARATMPQLTVTPQDCTLEMHECYVPGDPVLRAVDPDGSFDAWPDEIQDNDAISEPAMIVIEDDPPPAHQVIVVRRQGYGEAFGNLRRG